MVHTAELWLSQRREAYVGPRVPRPDQRRHWTLLGFVDVAKVDILRAPAHVHDLLLLLECVLDRQAAVHPVVVDRAVKLRRGQRLHVLAPLPIDDESLNRRRDRALLLRAENRLLQRVDERLEQLLGDRLRERHHAVEKLPAGDRRGLLETHPRKDGLAHRIVEEAHDSLEPARGHKLFGVNVAGTAQAQLCAGGERGALPQRHGAELGKPRRDGGGKALVGPAVAGDQDVFGSRQLPCAVGASETLHRLDGGPRPLEDELRPPRRIGVHVTIGVQTEPRGTRLGQQRHLLLAALEAVDLELGVAVVGHLLPNPLPGGAPFEKGFAAGELRDGLRPSQLLLEGVEGGDDGERKARGPAL